MTPTDDMAFIGFPPLPQFRPEADQVHVSVTFTWDREEGARLREAWAQHYEIVLIGGPAIDGVIGERVPGMKMRLAEFVPGMYVRRGVTITSRGCPRNCPWCMVPTWEGELRTIPIQPGWVVQDNNLLACPKEHIKAVFEMLRTRGRAVSFPGGLDARLLTPWVASQLRTLRIQQLFLAADTNMALEPLAVASKRLPFLSRRQKRCYVMIGYDGETLREAEARLKAVWSIGCMPFAILFQPTTGPIKYSPDWKALMRSWARPAAMIASHSRT